MSAECKGAIGVILAIAIVFALIFCGWALVVAQGMEQTCTRSGGVWTAHDAPSSTVGTSGSIHDRKCQR